MDSSVKSVASSSRLQRYIAQSAEEWQRVASARRRQGRIRGVVVRYIKTKSHGADIYLNVEKIDFVSEKDDTCEVFIAGSDYPLKVEDTAGEIMEKVAKVEGQLLEVKPVMT